MSRVVTRSMIARFVVLSIVAIIALNPIEGWAVNTTLGQWKEKFSSGRAGAPTALDPVTRRWIVSGGVNPYGRRAVMECAIDDVQPAWRQIPTDGQPAPAGLRIESSLVFDSRRGRWLDYGGLRREDDGGDQVWSFDPASNPHWTLLETTGATAPPNYGHAAAYDSVADAMYVYGGRHGGEDGSLWRLSFADATPTWSILTVPSPGPSARLDASLWVDQPTRRLILIGGRSSETPTTPDVWALALDDGQPAWQQITVAGEGPRDRGPYPVAFDDVHRRAYVLAGPMLELDRLDVWELDLSDTPTWRFLRPVDEVPPGRVVPSIAFDRVRSQLWLSFGLVAQANGSAIYANDVWSATIGEGIDWNKHSEVPEPSVRSALVSGWDAARGRLIVCGGDSYSGYPTVGRFYGVQRDVWALDRLPNGDLAWSPMPTTGTGPGRISLDAAVVDGVRDRLLVFDLDADAAQFPLVWELPLAPPHAWSPITPPYDQPGRRVATAAIQDPTHDRVIVFGGYDPDHEEVLDELWEFRLSPNPGWHRLEPSGSARPSARYGATFVYDERRHRGVLLGGATKTGFSRGALNDAWELVLDDVPRWVPIQTQGDAPFRRCFAFGAYDSERDRVLWYGGESQTAYHADAWALERSGTARWVWVMTPGTVPIPRGFGAAAFNPMNETMIVFAGASGDLDQGDVWELSVDGGSSPPPVVPDDAMISDALVRPTPTLGPAEIEFTAAGSGAARVSIVDLRGRAVRSWDLGTVAPGRQSVLWDGRDEDGRITAAGIYFTRVEWNGEVVATRRVVRISN